jgi:copper chaperone CopZ
MCDSASGCTCNTATIASAPPADTAAGVQATYLVAGMTCGGCAGKVSRHIGEIAGVTDVGVDVVRGAVTVSSDHDVDPAIVRAAVERAGYQIAG